MKKKKNLLLGIVLLFGAGGLTRGAIKSGDSFTSPELRASVFGLAFVGSWMLSLAFSNKRGGSVEKDEFTKKVGYTSLAFSAQVICLLGAMAFLINAFYPFLEKYTAFDALILTINGLVIINFFAYFYYSKNPEKIGF